VPQNQCGQSSGGSSSDGDGNAFLGTFQIHATPTRALFGAHVDASASYDPGVEGAISSVNVRFKLRHAGSNAVNGSRELRFARALVVQDGAYYTTPTTDWIAGSFSEEGLPAEGFSSFSGAIFPGQLGRIVAPDASLDLTAHPDFSSSGGPLHFGFVASVHWLTALPPGGVYETSFLVDEFSFEVDGDSDDDGVADALDNCTQRRNPDQSDGDGDLCGDVCDGDCNGDGAGGAPDWAIFAIEFKRGACSPVPCQCDRNFDGVVGAPDFVILVTNFFTGPSGLAGGGHCTP
jgi:hypothetical protein